MRFLFWNTHKNQNINRILCSLIVEYNINIVILAEYESNSEELIRILSQNGTLVHQYVVIGCDRIKLFGTLSMEDVEPSRANSYCTMQKIKDELLLCAVHMPSKLRITPRTQDGVFSNVIHEIEIAEEECDIANTIIVGDFNQNPYEGGCLGAQGFHGIPIADETKRLKRKIFDVDYKMFYNPMWNLLGDFNFPPGTYYYNTGEEINEFWHIFDQVLIRPSLRERFIDESLKIVTEPSSFNLMNKRKHPNKDISDHLPIVFEIKENLS